MGATWSHSGCEPLTLSSFVSLAKIAKTAYSHTPASVTECLVTTLTSSPSPSSPRPIPSPLSDARVPTTLVRGIPPDYPAFALVMRGEECTRRYTIVYTRVHNCIHTCTHMSSRYVLGEGIFRLRSRHHHTSHRVQPGEGRSPYSPRWCSARPDP